jgi:voltage-gated potassium channel
MQETQTGRSWPAWRTRLHQVIFGTDTPEGKLFDIILMLFIALSVMVVFVDSLTEYHDRWGRYLYMAEWFFTIVFTLEYFLRIISIRKPMSYIFSFYGLIDLLSFLPTYISLFVMGGQFLIILRVFRLLRIFRVLKLGRYLWASRYMMVAVRNSRHKIAVFLWFVIIIVVIMGTVMYLVEGPENGFLNIPISIYWAVVTLTTVGYGDISPQTGLGKAIASVIMIIGYGVIAVPTGIFAAEMARVRHDSTKECQGCNSKDHDPDADYCKHCGKRL